MDLPKRVIYIQASTLHSYSSYNTTQSYPRAILYSPDPKNFSIANQNYYSPTHNPSMITISLLISIYEVQALQSSQPMIIICYLALNKLMKVVIVMMLYLVCILHKVCQLIVIFSLYNLIGSQVVFCNEFADSLFNLCRLLLQYDAFFIFCL